MKKGLLLLPLIAVMLIAPAAMASTNTPVTPTPPVTLYFQVYGCQYQWVALGAYPGGPWGAWTFYAYYGQYSDGPFIYKGNTLTTTITFVPAVTPISPEPAPLVYTFNSELNIWILPPTFVTYYYEPFGPWIQTNIFTGYIAFTGKPSSSTYAEDVMYQWGYIYPQTGLPIGPTGLADVRAVCPNAFWDPNVGAWQVGMSVYVNNVAQTWVVTNNQAGPSTPYPSPQNGFSVLQPGQVTGVPFPSTFVPIEPFGPDNYDPLHL